MKAASRYFLLRTGHGDMVVMSPEKYEEIKFENEIFLKFKEAELESHTTDV